MQRFGVLGDERAQDEALCCEWREGVWRSERLEQAVVVGTFAIGTRGLQGGHAQG